MTRDQPDQHELPRMTAWSVLVAVDASIFIVGQSLRPPRWVTILSTDTTLEQARRSAESQFTADRVLKVERGTS